MGELAISMEAVSKSYRLGEHLGPGSLRDAIGSSLGRLLRRDGRPRGETIWALREVSFEMQRGEVLGVVGPNGAGKSTLLKILSRITEPTSGRATVYGRVGSLLEVGTGFHPELTGRENVLLNGAILGMSRAEIFTKFDEIVEFAGLPQFVDTPVKRYSSGMRLRLAFAVAAHLEPEILAIDEVLAVGDAAFQARCVDKMRRIAAYDGRTILVVSHNMSHIRALCDRAVYIEGGRVMGIGDVEAQIHRYLGGSEETTARIDLTGRTDRLGTGRIRLREIALSGSDGAPRSTFVTGEMIRIALTYSGVYLHGAPQWAVSLFNTTGEKIVHFDSVDRGQVLSPPGGGGVCTLEIPRAPFHPGVYVGDVRLTVDGEIVDYVQRAFRLEVGPGDFFGVGRVAPFHGGRVVLDHHWKLAPGAKAGRT